MKIIFDSEEQKIRLFNLLSYHACPGNVINRGHYCKVGDWKCKECWENNCEYDYEIKSDKEESIGMTNETKVTYTDAVYELIKDECEGMDAIYEDYIVSLVGRCGLGALKRAGLVEGCGTINCRQLYVLVDKKGIDIYV